MTTNTFRVAVCLGVAGLLTACAHQPKAKPEAPPTVAKPVPTPTPPAQPAQPPPKAEDPGQPKQSPVPPPRYIQVPQLQVKGIPGWSVVLNRFPIVVLKHQKTEAIVMFRMVPTLQAGPPAAICQTAQQGIKKQKGKRVGRIIIAKNKLACHFTVSGKYQKPGSKRPVRVSTIFAVQVSPQVKLVTTVMVGTWNRKYNRQMAKDFHFYRTNHRVVLTKVRANSRTQIEVDRLH